MGYFKKHFIKQLRKYRRARDGATAIEFAILLVPFSAMLFAIIELGIVFFIQAGVADTFEQKVCDNMAGLGDCGLLRVDVVSSSTGKFEPDLLPPTPTSDPDDPNAPPA